MVAPWVNAILVARGGVHRGRSSSNAPICLSGISEPCSRTS